MEGNATGVNANGFFGRYVAFFRNKKKVRTRDKFIPEAESDGLSEKELRKIKRQIRREARQGRKKETLMYSILFLLVIFALFWILVLRF